MNYGFLIRNDRCIGCHACSTACKSENEVPLGVHRTWVKNVEKGVYPNVRRHFQVTRCNHCANPPCVRICPVEAMYQRADGIVEFDPEICIGCKACLQACPYDAIYMDPDTGTAAKCHFCAHRVELDLEPACVVVCPEHAIVSGDLDDPLSEISRMLAEHQVTVRKPEQGTAPKLFYVDGEETALHPTATERAPETFGWSDVVALHGGEPRGRRPGAAPDANGSGPVPRPSVASPERRPGESARAVEPRRARSGAELREGAPQGVPAAGPIHVGRGRMAGEMVRNFWNAQHRVPWHWPVPAYLVTKGIGTGLFLLLGLGGLLGLFTVDGPAAVAGGALVLLATGVTTALLVFDLERPERFLSILYRPQWRSWLTRGAFLLVAFSAVVGGWWVAEVGGVAGWWAEPAALRPWVFGLGAPLALGVAVYTAFLFGQAEGRDLWQSTLLPAHLVLQALVAGPAALLWLAPFWSPGAGIVAVAKTVFAVALVADLLVAVGGELGMPHASDAAAAAAKKIRSGPYALHFWLGGVVLGHAVPLGLVLIAASPAAASLAGACALVGLYLYEHAFVMAPQEVPNS